MSSRGAPILYGGPFRRRRGSAIMAAMNATILQRNGIGRADSRRLVGLERDYHCGSCGEHHRSWSRQRSCPACGEQLGPARIRRAAVL
jgi:hypothetical protein